MKKTLLIITFLFSSQASNYWIHEPFFSNKAMNWYKNFISRYKVPTVHPMRKIKIAIIDTGYSSPFATKNYIQNEGGYNEDHGTHITGIILAINPNAEIHSYNVFQDEFKSSITINKTAQAIKDAVKKNVDLINISMSGANTSEEELSAIAEAQNAGIMIVAAAGNFNENLSSDQCDTYPACNKKYFSNIIVVGNLMNSYLKNPSSNFGEMVDVSFNGSMVESLSDQGLSYKTGTSQATAFITGFLSLSMSLSHKRLSIDENKSLLFKNVGSIQKQAGLMKVHYKMRDIASISK